MNSWRTGKDKWLEIIRDVEAKIDRRTAKWQKMGYDIQANINHAAVKWRAISRDAATRINANVAKWQELAHDIQENLSKSKAESLGVTDSWGTFLRTLGAKVGADIMARLGSEIEKDWYKIRERIDRRIDDGPGKWARLRLEGGGDPTTTIGPDEQGAKKAVTSHALCPYCGDLLGNEPVSTCQDCRTPHHRDCWQANGGCTTLGCPETPLHRL